MGKYFQTPIVKAIEVEKYILEMFTNNDFSLICDGRLKKTYKNGQLEYAEEAFRLPYFIIKNDENLKSSYLENFNFSDGFVAKRYRCAHLINQYLEKHQDVSFPDIELYNKLVRDNIPEILNKDADQNVIYYSLFDIPYLQNLESNALNLLNRINDSTSNEEVLDILSDKLEIINSLARFYGYSYGEVVELAEAKRSKFGGYTKKYSLIGTYE